MKRNRPGVLAVRALNQYRRCDVVTYLGLRYYLQNSAAQTDTWARTVATDLVISRTSNPYFHVPHFKEITSEGRIEHRVISLPGPNEVMAESALLDECAKHKGAFCYRPCVYSYHLNTDDARSGIFINYLDGLQRRQQDIAKACENYPTGIVLYTDIKSFYSTIATDRIMRAWRRQSEQAGLPHKYRDLGDKIIGDHGKASGRTGSSILTGPMFSHFLGNP